VKNCDSFDIFTVFVAKIVKKCIMLTMKKDIAKISELRERYYSQISGKESLLKIINETEIADQVFNSNAIENSTLTLEETEKILMQIDLDRLISERELFEARNLARVVSYIELRAKEQELSKSVILTLHKMLISNIRDDIAGRFRITEWVRVGNHIGADPAEVERLLDIAINRYNASSDSIVARLARLHLDFETIHPFVDGNGRIGRVINNYLLIREGYVPINIKFADRVKYYDAFKEFSDKKRITIMEDIFMKALTNSYYRRLAYLEGKEIISLKEYARRTKQSHSNATNKAVRQTIEAFLEGGVWKIGV
jgi:Fic family protein